MERLRKILLRDDVFIVLMIMIAAGIMASTNLFVTDGVGGMGSVSIIMMLNEALSSGDYTVLIGFAGGFLIARVLEGPLVGILDIGGSLMAGVGFGVFGLLASTSFGAPVTTSFLFALFAGAVVGLILGAVIMLIRKFVPEGVNASGTDLMMGVGHQLGAWLPPLILLSALQYNIVVGLAASVGALIFHLRGKSLMGGMILGLFIAAFFVPVVA